MNIYVLVEGISTEYKVYPKWFSHIIEGIEVLENFIDATSEKNGLYIISGNGYPSILNHIKNSIEDINETNTYDHFFIIVDSDEVDMKERKAEILESVSEHGPVNATVKVIVQCRCFETWVLGNQRIISRRSESKELNSYIGYYDVINKNPEFMGDYNSSDYTHSQFHTKYAKTALSEKNIPYRKNSPGAVCEKHYFEMLATRIDNTNHLESFADFYDYVQKIQNPEYGN
jgi:hypothetical protein